MREGCFRGIRKIRAYVAIAGLLINLVERLAGILERLHEPGKPRRRLLRPG